MTDTQEVPVVVGWLKRLLHKHAWQDWYVFDSCIERNLDTGESRVLGVAVMMGCECGAMKRRPLKTWAEADMVRSALAPKDGTT